MHVVNQVYNWNECGLHQQKEKPKLDRNKQVLKMNAI